MAVFRLWPFISLALLSFSSYSEASKVTDLPFESENGILTRSWKYFENMVQTAFEDDEKEEANRHVPVPDESLDAIREEIRRRFARYKAQVEEVHGLNGPIKGLDLDKGEDSADHSTHNSRQKRAIIRADNIQPGRRRRNITDYYNTVGTREVKSVFPLQPQPYDYKSLLDLNIVQIKGQSYLFSLEQTTEGTYTSISTIDKDLNPREIYRLSTPGATTVEIFETDQNYYVLPGEYDNEYNRIPSSSQDPIDAGSNLYRFDIDTNTLQKVQTINTEYAQTFRFWTGAGEEANDVFLLVAPEYKRTVKGITYKVEAFVYRWQGLYFDQVYNITAYNPQAIQHAKIYSTGYLGIANYQDDSKSTSIHSEILRYNHKESRYVSFQKILTHGAKDIQFFSVTAGQREEHYLAIANHVKMDQYGKTNYKVKSYILKYATERYIPFQSIETYGAFQILPVKMDDISFLVIGEMTGIRIVQYNGWRFTETYSIPFLTTVGDDTLKFRSFIHGNQPYFSVASTDQNVEGGIYALKFDSRNDHQKATAALETWCVRALNTVNSEDMPGLVAEAAAAPKLSDNEIVLGSSLTFTQALRVKNLYGKTLNYGGLVFDAQLSKQLAAREADFKSLEEELRNLELQLSQVVLKNTDQTIHTEIRFEDIFYNGQPFRASNVQTELLNGYRLTDLLSKLIYLGKDYSFATVTIEQLKTDQHIQVEKLNGYLLSDFALKSADYLQTFTKKNQFLEVATAQEGFQVSGLVDGVNFKNIDFLLKAGNQTFVGGITIRESTVNNLISSIVNKVDLQYYYDEAVSKTGTVTITGNKNFNTVSATSFDAQSISGVNINQLYEKAIYLKGVQEQTFQARETQFEHLIVDSVSLSSNKINDRYNVETDFVSISRGTYNIDSMELLYDTFIDQLLVNRSLNKVQVIDGQLDIILKDSPLTQLIGNKVIDTIVLEKNSEAFGLVDGVNLTGWSNEKFIELRDNRVRVGRFTTQGFLSVPRGIYIDKYGKFYQGSTDISLYLSKALTLDATRLPVSFRGTISFESVQVAGNSQVRTINRLSPSQWVINKEGETAVITGKKIFTGDITLLQSSSAKALFYALDRYAENVLLGFDDLLIDGTDQTIQRNSVFNGLLRVDSLTCPGVVLNGIPFQNLLIVNGNQEVQGKVTFKKAIRVKNSFDVNGNINTELLNGYSLTSVIQDTLRTYSSIPQVFTGTITFSQGLSVENIASTGLVGGYNLTQLLENIILDNDLGSTVIQGSITFNKGAKLNRLEFKGTLNGIRDEDWGEGYLLSTGYQVIYTPVRFQGSVTVDNITVTNEKVSNLNFVRLSNEILRIDQDGQVGVISFESTLNSGQDVYLDRETGRVNGLRVWDELLLKNGPNPQIITADKIFQSGLKIDGFLDVKYLAGIDYNQAAKFAFGKTSPQDNLRIEGNLNLKNEPFFSHSFNGDDWATLINNIWWTNEAATLGYVQFSHVILQEGGTLNGNLSGVDLANLENGYLSITRDQRVSGKFSFDNGVTFRDVNAQKIQLNGGRINGINLEQFLDSVLLDGVNQSIYSRMTFDTLNVQELEVENGALVGNLDLSANTVTLHGENIISGAKTFENLNVGELYLTEGTLLDGINLEEWKKLAINPFDSANITGNLNFAKASFSRDLSVTGDVDNLQFNRDNILTLSGNQVVTGTYTFDHSKYGNESFICPVGFEVEYFNGFNFTEVISTLVLRDYGTGPLIVTGEKTFARPLNIESLSFEALYQGYDINETLNDLQPESYLSGQYNYSLEEKYLELTKLALELHYIADRRAVFLGYYEISSGIEITYSTSFRVFNSEVLITAQTGINSYTVTRWTLDAISESFQYDVSDNFLVNGVIQDAVSFTNGNQNYMVVSVVSQNGQDITTQNPTQLNPVNGDFQFMEGQSKLYLLKTVTTDIGRSLVVSQVITGPNFGQLVASIQYTNASVRENCVLVNSKDGHIFCLRKNGLEHTQKLLTQAVTQMATVLVGRKTYYITGDIGVNENGKLGEVVNIFLYTGGSAFKVDCHPFINLVSIDAAVGSFRQVYIALASGHIKGTQYFGSVQILRSLEEGNKFRKIQSISVRKPLVVKFQSLEPVSSQQFLYILTRSTVYVYSYQGLSGFVLEHELSTEDAIGLEVLTTAVKGVFKAQVLVRSVSQINVFTLELNGLIQYRNSSLSISSSTYTSETVSNAASTS